MATLIYFLLRHDVDGNSFDEVFLEEEQEPDDLLPLVGLAATPMTMPTTTSISKAALPDENAVIGHPIPTPPPVDLAE